MRINAIAIVIFVGQIVTATSDGKSKSPAESRLKFDFVLQDASLTESGAIKGRLLVHILSGRASFTRDVDPFLSSMQPTECSTGKALSYGEMDYVSSEQDVNIVDEGTWYGRDLMQPYISAQPIPDCVVARLVVIAKDADFPGASVKVEHEIRLRKQAKILFPK